MKTDREILEHARSFFKKLYDVEHTDREMQDWFINKITRVLSYSERSRAEGQ